MSYDEVMKFALAHYYEGGDATYECLSEYEYDMEIASGTVYTEDSLLKTFATWKNVYTDMQGW